MKDLTWTSAHSRPLSPLASINAWINVIRGEEGIVMQPCKSLRLHIHNGRGRE